MKEIFVVWGGDFYERTDNLRAFESEDDAKRFVAMLQCHQDDKPRFDTSDLDCEIGSPEFSREFDAWKEKLDDLERNSPAYQGYRGADEFGVEQIDLHEASK